MKDCLKKCKVHLCLLHTYMQRPTYTHMDVHIHAERSMSAPNTQCPNLKKLLLLSLFVQTKHGGDQLGNVDRPVYLAGRTELLCFLLSSLVTDRPHSTDASPLTSCTGRVGTLIHKLWFLHCGCRPSYKCRFSSRLVFEYLRSIVSATPA